MPDQYTLLLEWRRAEAATRGLAKLPQDFYRTTAAYLAEIRKIFEDELRENPSGRKGELARQTHQRAGQVARDIIEARMTKILSQAFQASIGGTKEVPNTLPEERTLFDSLVGVMRSHRSTVAPFLEPIAPVPGRTAASLATAREAAGAPPKPTPLGPPMRFVRILKDSRPVELGSETIELHKEDLLSLPEAIAQILIDGKIAEPVESPAP
jgi:DNA replication initiation complex subunit (GINS family)